MTLPDVRVPVVPLTELEWRFDGERPLVRFGSADSWGRTVAVDPCPAYGHDEGLVTDVLRWVEACWPPEGPLTYWLLDREPVERTNGWSEYLGHRRRPGEVEWWTGHVVLGGKRIPPHPAVTKYVVAHEYGHHVQWWISRRRGISLNHADELLQEYAGEVRGIEHVDAFPGTWHLATGEVFADDFRIVVAGVEPSYWPHPGISHPLTEHGGLTARLRAWWGEAFSLPSPVPVPEPEVEAA